MHEIEVRAHLAKSRNLGKAVSTAAATAPECEAEDDIIVE